MSDLELSAKTRISKAARSPEELFLLIAYCRAGKLKEVSEWISAGKPIDPLKRTGETRRRSQLQVAIEKGFFAMAELLLDGGCDSLSSNHPAAAQIALGSFFRTSYANAFS